MIKTREQKLKSALEYGIVIACNAYEVNEEEWKEARKKFLDEAHEALKDSKEETL